MSYPQWKCIGNLGDRNIVDHGGLLVFVDKTGVHCPEMEKIEPWGSNPTWEVYRVTLDPCTFRGGILSDNEFHPYYPAWFADKLGNVSKFVGLKKSELIAKLCSDDPIERAEGYRAIFDYFGWHQGDDYPLNLDKGQILDRVAGYDIPD